LSGSSLTIGVSTPVAVGTGSRDTSTAVSTGTSSQQLPQHGPLQSDAGTFCEASLELWFEELCPPQDVVFAAQALGPHRSGPHRLAPQHADEEFLPSTPEAGA